MKRELKFSKVVLSIAVGLVASLATGDARADVRLPKILGDGMVLQRNTDVTIWGWASPGEVVKVTPSWSDQVVEATPGDDGRWQVRIGTPDAGGPHSIDIAGATKIKLDDVLIGEVWICSGQSNMEWPLRSSENPEQAIAAAEFPLVRTFIVKNTSTAHRRIDVEGAWQVCSPQAIGAFSAVGYYFGKRLHEDLDVPVGLISADWGGTVVEAWTSAEALQRFPEFADVLEFIDIIKDPTTRQGATEKRQNDWWRSIDRRARIGSGWTGASFDDAKWKSMVLPATLGPDGLDAFDGFVYFRRTVELPASMRGKPAVLEMGPIDDFDDIWVNGVHVGSTHAPDSWDSPRKYEVPAKALSGNECIVAVRMLDTAGAGGINGKPEQLVLRQPNGGESLELAGSWKYTRGPAVDRIPSIPTGPAFNQNTPTALFNGMIAPLTNMTIRGAIWYQGESNRTRARQYRSLFPGMIRSWREEWGLGDFPFYFVQIAPFGYRGDTGQAAMLREAQMMALETPNTGMAVTMDIGNPGNIHPRNKHDVGDRLARWALAKTYGKKKVVHTGPLYRGVAVEGSSMRLRFDGVAGGLVFRDSATSHFQIAGKDRMFVDGKATIDGDTIVVTSARVANPVSVRYAWGAASQPNLFNAEGLPASSFRTDDWSLKSTSGDNSAEMKKYRSTARGFEPLFNGKNLDGWTNANCAPGTWRAQDGKILCSGFPTGVLRTNKHYQNFILELEYRHMKSKGNAGVFVWSDPVTAKGQPFTRGVEVQVLDGREGDWFTSDGDIFPIHGAVMTPQNGRGGSRAFPTEKRAHPSPYWNYYRITCRDGRISLAVNGKVVTRGEHCSPRQGYICLESEGSPVEFRNIRIKELLSSEIHAKHVADVDEGFVSIYNGVDFSGWKHGPEHKDHWKVADWRIDFDGKAPDLWSEKSYGDFVLICDWRWSGQPKEGEFPVVLPNGDYKMDAEGKRVMQKVMDAGDSGIYLRGSAKSQVNMWSWPCGSGEVYGYRNDAKMSPEVRAGVTPKIVADAPIGKWNRFVITMKGDRLTVVLNGQEVLSEAQLPGVAASGPIALQNHGAPIQFANIYIKELKTGKF